MPIANFLLREVEPLRRNWVWFLLLGIALIVLGLIAIGSATMATVATMLFFGWLLLFGGILQIVHAFWARQWCGFLLQLVVGVLQAVIGGLMVTRPLSFGLALTLLMAVFFVVGGVFRMIAAASLPFEGRGWLLLSGLIDLIMGIIIWSEWPQSGLWVIGLFVGIDLLIHGWWLVMLSLSARTLPTGSAGPVV
ncbi:MAG TPA: HdeD family acid-resistance protein [Gemmataceae bacterium]|jgi:uncharacterized membrane protein HdeD (DUF308 family)